MKISLVYTYQTVLALFQFKSSAHNLCRLHNQKVRLNKSFPCELWHFSEKLYAKDPFVAYIN